MRQAGGQKLRQLADKPRTGGELPRFVAPCLARLADAPPEGAQWVHEVKFDGYRLQVRVDNGSVRLLTRTGLDWTERFAGLAQVLARLPVTTALIDGESIVEDARGATDFVALVDALKGKAGAHIAFVAFDLMHLDGRDYTKLPLLERKAALKRVIAKGNVASHVRYSDHVVGNGVAMLAAVCRQGLEGIISKRVDKPYASGRHGDWIKSKCLLSDEFVIAGFVASTAIKNAIGALVLGYYRGTKLVYAGRVGTGFSRAVAADLYRQLERSQRVASPFATPLAGLQAKGVTFVEPQLIAHVTYRAWTGDGLLRHASFGALREDKPARHVRAPASLKAALGSR